jgi:hypothetical protein
MEEHILADNLSIDFANFDAVVDSKPRGKARRLRV